MNVQRERGLTLAELLVTTAVMAIIGMAAAGLLDASLQAHQHGTGRASLHREGLLAMSRMTEGVRRCTFLLVPNAHTVRRDLLVFSGLTNDDKDHYFDDVLFPRIDEDLSWDMNADGKNGVQGVDDDGDGSVDEFSLSLNAGDDDEDGLAQEDWLDGVDNDGDGNVDEDCDWDSNVDGAPGVAGVDDDGDGLVDEGHQGDDDEDGSLDEVGLFPVVYSFDGKGTLWEKDTFTGEAVALSTHVQSFLCKYKGIGLVKVELILADDDGTRITFVEDVHLRNVQQRTGKRVR